MSVNKYQIFLRAVDTGSLSGAAEDFGYTPSGIVHMMNSLEAEFGFPLLKRSRKGVRLTADGERIVPILRDLVKCKERLQQAASEINGAVMGSITIGTYFSIGINWLPPVIQRMQQDCPGIKVNILEGVHQKLDGLLQENLVDFCLFSRHEQSGYEWIRLKSDPMVAMVPPDHPMATCTRFPIQAYGREGFIMPAEGYDYDIMRVLDKHQVVPQVSYSTGEDRAAIAMIENGLGVGLFNKLTTDGVETKAVRMPLWPEESIELGVAIPSIKRAAPAARRFLGYLQSYVRELE